MDFSGILRCIILLELVTVAVTIKASDGDDVECVDKMMQPTFDSKLLKNHRFQESPSEIPRTVETEEKNKLQTWEAQVSTANCPERTVPLRIYNDSRLNGGTATHTASHAPVHEYAEATTDGVREIYGTKAKINVWNPKVEGKETELSISQIWLSTGDYETNDLNTIEVGWQVYPRLYNDNKPRLFIYWTSDGYKETGGYNLKKPGFIQTNNRVVLGGSVSPVSIYGGRQYEISVLVWKDRKSGNWWLSVGADSLIGYWPGELFTGLADHAIEADWGGEIADSRGFNRHTKTQMGSGHFPEEGFGKSSYIRNIQIVDDNCSFQTIQQLRLQEEGTYYAAKNLQTNEFGTHFFFGGPGFGGHRHSGVVPLSMSLYFCISLLVFSLSFISFSFCS